MQHKILAEIKTKYLKLKISCGLECCIYYNVNVNQIECCMNWELKLVEFVLVSGRYSMLADFE